MFKIRISKFDKVLSAILVMIMLFSVIPSSVFAETANNPGKFTFYIKNVHDEDLNGVSIDYTISVNDDEKASGNVTTDANGEAVIDDMSSFADDVADGKTVKVAYHTTKANYVDVSDTYTVTSVTDNIDLILNDVEKVTVSVAKTGKGTVKINGTNVTSSTQVNKGDTVSIEIKPTDNDTDKYIIKSVKINTVVQDITNTSLFTKSITVSADTIIDVEFVEYYTVSVSSYSNGTVSINGKTIGSGGSIKLEKDSSASYTVSTSVSGGYGIKSIKLGNATVPVTDLYNVSDSFTVTKDIVLTVSFAKTYKLKAVYTSSDGKIKFNDTDYANNQLLVVVDGNNINVRAVPNENYRVKQVLINSVKDTDYTAVNDGQYSKQLTNINKDYTIEAEFELNRYNVTISHNSNNGTESFSSTDSVTSKDLAYNSDAPVLYIYPNTGYDIDSVMCGGESLKVEHDDDLDCFVAQFNSAKKVTADLNYEVNYIENKGVGSFKNNVMVIINCGSDTVTFNDDKDNKNTAPEDRENPLNSLADLTSANTNGILVRKDGNMLVFKPDTTITFKNLNWRTANNSRRKINVRFKWTDESFSLKNTNNANDKRWLSNDESYVRISRNSEISNIRVYTDSNYNNSLEYVINSYDNESITYTIVIDSDKPEITGITSADNENEFYSFDFDVKVSATDNNSKKKNNEEIANSYSGIKSIKYSVKADDTVIQGEGCGTETGLIYNAASQSQSANNVGFTLDTSRITDYCDNIVVTFTVTDFAGNTKTASSEVFKFCNVQPAISVSNTGEQNDDTKLYGQTYKNRTFTVDFTEKNTSVYNVENAKKCISVNLNGTAKKVSELTPSDPVTVSYGTSSITLAFTENGKYSVNVDKEAYKNKAGLSMDNTTADYSSGIFYIDADSPTAELTFSNKTWSELLSALTFGLYSKDQVTIKASSVNTTCTVGSDIDYYTAEYCVLTESQAEELKNDHSKATTYTYTNKFDSKTSSSDSGITIDSDKAFVVVAKITDYGGNIKYVSTNGIVYDTKDCVIEITPPASVNDVGGNKSKNYNVVDIANGNGKITLKADVVDEVKSGSEDNAYSGIKSIDYEIIDLNSNSDSPIKETGNLYTFDKSDPTQSQLVQNKASLEIPVDPVKFNSSSVKVLVKVTDNAGNESESFTVISINNSTPKIEVEYEDEKIIGSADGYYTKRVATVTYTCLKNKFSEEKALQGITITEKDFAGADVTGTYDISDNWVVSPASDPALEKHSITITYNGDANYTFDATYTDESNNSGSDDVAAAFAVDTSLPTGKVTVDESFWTTLVETLLFFPENVKNTKATVKIESEDATAGIDKVYYYKSNNGILAKSNLEDLAETDWIEYTEFTVDPDELFTVYAKIVDKSGNYDYISSNGIIVDETPCEIVITPPANVNNYDGYKYNMTDVENGGGNIDVNVKVTDKIKDGANENAYSGIKKVTYKIVDLNTSGENLVEETGTLYEFTNDAPTQADLLHDFEGIIPVDGTKFNSSNVEITVFVEDNAGNESASVETIDINNTAPTIEVSYKDTQKDNAADGYFSKRVATIVYTCRTDKFDEDKAIAGITITAKNLAGKDIANTYSISSWTHVEGDTPDAATHTIKITYKGEANYTFAATYTDESNNKDQGVIYATEDDANTKFTVDTVAPTGSITYTQAEKNGRSVTSTELVDELTFGFWSRKGIKITSSSKDITAGVQHVMYYIYESEKAVDNTTALTVSDLDALDESAWTEYEKFKVSDNKQFTVYLRITDNSGNYTYISTNGLIMDDQHPLVESVAPEITVTPEQPINDIYNGDVKVNIKVVDPLVDGAYSGIKEIRYKVFDKASKTPDKATQEGTLYTFNVSDPKQTELKQEWTGNITVLSKKNNSNKIQIVVYAVDNAGNEVNTKDKASQGYRVIKIDTTAPTIDISYDNNNADSGTYFKKNRVATIKITERNFNADDVIVKITNTDGVIPKLVGWTNVAGKYNKDDSTHTATITYSADGDYTFSIEYTDKAGNKCESVKFANNTKASNKFTIDKTVPTISVSYNNNNSLNGNYYKDARTATVTIKEHNFNPDRVDFIISATDDGAAGRKATKRGWVSNGDIHTIKIDFPGDALYKFDVTCKDKAGNSAAKYKTDEFYIDNTDPEIKIENVQNNQPYNDTIAPKITITDTNFDSNNVTITLRGSKNGEVKYNGSYSDIHNGRIFTYADFEHKEEVDDIYTLSVKLTDKAGRESSEEVTFFVNRFGSVYELEENSSKIVNTFNQKSPTVIVYEHNVNKLEDIAITLNKNNGKEKVELVAGKNYNIDIRGGGNSWYTYVYQIFDTNFEEDGVYSLTIHSKDAAGNIAENTLDTKNFIVNFGVDKTAPIITALNLIDNGFYGVESYTVKLSVQDNLSLKTVDVYLDNTDEGATPVKSWTAEEVEQIIKENGEFEFDIPGTTSDRHIVRVVATDASGRAQELFVKDFQVTTNSFAKFINNKPLFYGSIGGVVALAALIVFLVVFKRRKKDDKKETPEVA